MEEDSDEEEAGPKPAEAAPVPQMEPNHILDVSGLPKEITDDMLKVLFQQYIALQTRPT